MCSPARISAVVQRQDGRTLHAEAQISTVTAHHPADRTPAVEEEIRSATARQAAGRTPGPAGTQGQWTEAGLSSVETAAPFQARTGEVRRGISVAAGIKACPLLEAAVGVEAA